MTHDDYMNILKSAVDNEIEAYDFYRKAAEIAADPAIKAVFGSLAKDELKHKVLLEGYLDGSTELCFDEAQDYKVSETVESPKLTTDMRFSDAIALAMKKEEEAMKMYGDFAQRSTDSSQRDMFMALSKMESGHKANLEELFVNVAFAEVW